MSCHLAEKPDPNPSRSPHPKCPLSMIHDVTYYLFKACFARFRFLSKVRRIKVLQIYIAKKDFGFKQPNIYRCVMYHEHIMTYIPKRLTLDNLCVTCELAT